MVEKGHLCIDLPSQSVHKWVYFTKMILLVASFGTLVASFGMPGVRAVNLPGCFRFAILPVGG